MIRTAECVTPMHPDKICDRISDAVLDACLRHDSLSRVAIETMGGHGIVSITGELTTNANIDIRQIAKEIASKDYGVQVNVVKQSPEIACGVDTGGAGDQGIMVGYATRETEDLIPLESSLARSLCRYIYKLRPFDGKTQITVNDNGEVIAIVASFQNTTKEDLAKMVKWWVEKEGVTCNNPAEHYNPSGDWSIGGFEADTGLTGRKLAVDNYGPRVPIGGGAFSGKDATKVDRSAAYAARKAAVTILESNPEYESVLVRLAYSIGVAEPVEASAEIVTNGKTLYKLLQAQKFTPNMIIKDLDLRKAQYAKTAEFGHFGNGFTWDKPYDNIADILL